MDWTRAEIKPDKERRVLVTVSHPGIRGGRVQVATYVGKFRHEATGDDEFRVDVDTDENGTEFWPEGWYEDYDEERVTRIMDPVLAWAPLPEPFNA